MMSQKVLMPLLKVSPIAAVTVLASLGHAQSLFPAGTAAKSAAMESAMHSNGAPALLYNPARIATFGQTGKRRHIPYLEFGVANVSYSYEHPDFDPVFVDVRTPTLTLGHVSQVTRRLAIGGVLYPTRRGSRDVDAVPRQITPGSIAPLAIESKEEAYQLGLGGAFHVNRYLTTGVSIIGSQERQAVSSGAPHADTVVLEYEAKNRSYRPVVGAYFGGADLGGASGGRHTILQAALTFKPQQTREFTGTRIRAGVEQDGPVMVTYQPAEIGLGLGTNWRRLNFSAELQHQLWAKGSDIYQAAHAEEKGADFKNVTNRGMSIGYQFSRATSLRASYAFLPTPWGDGAAPSGPSEGESPGQTGIDFGNVLGIDRNVYGLGTKTKIRNLGFSLAAYRAHGQRLVPEGSTNEGYYQVAITTVSGGVSADF